MFEHLIGYNDIKKELELTLDIMKHQEKYKQLGVHCPRGVIFQGEPGLGKTLTAKDFIAASGWHCVEYDRTVFNSENTDNDEVNQIELARVFQKAEQQTPCIVFLDDFDKVEFGWGNPYYYLQSLIDKYQDADIFVLITMNPVNNFLTSLNKGFPASLSRAGRLEKVIEFNVPQYEEAVSIIQYYMQQKNFKINVDYALVAKLMDGHSCATLESVINTAGMYAGFHNRQCIEEEDIIRACLRVIYNAPESTTGINKKAHFRVACHEAGHAVLTALLKPEALTLASAKKYDGNIQGFNCSASSEIIRDDIEEIESEIKISFAGKAATELVLGDADGGCGKDMANIDTFVDTLLMDGIRFIGDGYGQASRAMLKDKYYFETKRLLVQNRAFLDEVIKELDEKDILTYKDIFKIKQNTESKKAKHKEDIQTTSRKEQ